MKNFEKIKKMNPLKMAGLLVLAGLLFLTGCDKIGTVETLHVTSDPTSAEVFVDGVKKGITPLTISGLSKGSHLLKLTRKGFNPVYKSLILTKGGRREIKFALKPVTGLLLVESDPSGADLTVNGIFKGTTPVLITDLPLGSYSLNFKATGQLPRTMTVDLEDRIPLKVMGDLASNMAQLTVNSFPTNAEVRIDGNLIGKTPLIYDKVEAGESEVMVAVKGYRPYIKKMTFEASKPYTLNPTLEPLPSGLTIISAPSGAHVIIDKNPVGKTPTTVTNLNNGTHEVVVRLPGYARQKKTIELQPDAKESLEFTLVKDSGTLVVDTEPANVEIYVDGRHVTTTVQKGPSDALSQTTRLLLKSKRAHKIQFVREGFISEELIIQTKINEVVTKHVVLKRIFVYDTRITTKKEVIDCRIEYKLPNGDIYYERYPGVFNTAKAADIIKVEAISLDDAKNRAARRLIEQNKKSGPKKKKRR